MKEENLKINVFGWKERDVMEKKGKKMYVKNKLATLFLLIDQKRGKMKGYLLLFLFFILLKSLQLTGP